MSVPHHDGLCFLARHGVSVGQAFFLEFISTFLLTLIIFGTILDTTYKEMNDSKYLRIIFGIGGLVLAVEPFTGMSYKGIFKKLELCYIESIH